MDKLLFDFIMDYDIEVKNNKRRYMDEFQSYNVDRKK